MKNTIPKKLALIHHIDNDGLMSGYLLSLYYQQEIQKGSAVLIPYNYTVYESWMIDDSFTEYVFVDITPPLDWIKSRKKEILKGKINVSIYDHHLAKYQEIEKLLLSKGWEKLNSFVFKYIFDETKSGCKILALSLGFKNVNGFSFEEQENIEKLKLLIDIISDYDTWVFTSNEYVGRKFNENDTYMGIVKDDILAINTHMMDFKDLTSFSKLINSIIDKSFFQNAIFELIYEGKQKINQIIIENEAKIRKGYYSQEKKIFIFEGYPNYWIRKQIESKYPNCIYWIGYIIDLAKPLIKFSIRSEKANDCVEIAKFFDVNGGGHSKASSFTLSLSNGFNFLCCPEIFFKV